MRKLVAIAFCGLTIASAAQYIGGTGGGGATNCSAAFAMLPVELLHFTAEADQVVVQLRWATATELNNAGFHVERSSDGIRYDVVTEVEGMGTTQVVTHYEAVDQAPLPGLSYYRLRQTDFDGTSTLSDVVAVEMTGAQFIGYPNPTAATVTILDHTGTGALEVKVFDPQGRAVLRIAVTEGPLEVDLRALPAGLYRLLVRNPKGQQALSIVKE